MEHEHDPQSDDTGNDSAGRITRFTLRDSALTPSEVYALYVELLYGDGKGPDA